MIVKRIWIIELENVDNDDFVFNYNLDTPAFNRLTICVLSLAVASLFNIYI